jgi:hypothetical protein
MSLKAEIDGKNDPLSGISLKIGDKGNAASRLAPMDASKLTDIWWKQKQTMTLSTKAWKSLLWK